MDKTIRILDREFTRRDAVKAGGLAGLGLAFAAPLIRSVTPLPAFADYAQACAAPDISFNSTEGSHAIAYDVSDPLGIASITVTRLSGTENPDLHFGALDAPNQSLALPFTHAIANCPDTTSILVAVDVDDAASSSYKFTVTNCCGNTAFVDTPELTRVI